MAPTAELPPIAEVLPHRGRMLLLDRLLAHAGDTTDARVRVEPRGWLHGEDGSAPGWLAVEYMAQCMAAHEGVIALREGRRPEIGLLVGIRGLELHRARLAAGLVLRVRARRVRGRPGIGALSHVCSVHVENDAALGALIAEGRLSVSVPAAHGLRTAASPERW